ncbi:hypothetical protein BT63DRAFT_457831 [Microthyrium microscopicum]|uniref:Uncharacterized protein n=1 Tax=Microthyrium microscopicum TaxID=703497 RepID=A0A6A6U6F5_9PEZI|nr:hypothetical protein BT63DRAFT_457831 [Microthyrium microscopicum]
MDTPPCTSPYVSATGVPTIIYPIEKSSPVASIERADTPVSTASLPIDVDASSDADDEVSDDEKKPLEKRVNAFVRKSLVQLAEMQVTVSEMIMNRVTAMTKKGKSKKRKRGTMEEPVDVEEESDYAPSPTKKARSASVVSARSAGRGARGARGATPANRGARGAGRGTTPVAPGVAARAARLAGRGARGAGRAATPAARGAGRGFGPGA